MSDQDLKTTVRVDTVSDTAGIQKAEQALSRAEERVKRLQLAADRAAKSDATNTAKIEQASKRLAQADEVLGQRRQKLADAREDSQAKIALGERKIALEERKADDAKAIRQRKLDQDAEKAQAEKADRQRKLDVTEKKVDAERADRQTRLAQTQTRIERDAEREARVRQNKADQANRRRQAALSQQERQQAGLAASVQKTDSVYERINRTLGFKGILERQQGSITLNDFRARTKAAQDLYKGQLAAFSGLSAEEQRGRLRSRDAYNLAIAEARSSHQTRMAYARAEQTAFNRDIREREAAHRRLHEQVSRGYGQMRSGLGQALQAGRTPALYGAAAAGALTAAGVKGIRSHMEIDAAETNMMTFALDRKKADGTKKTFAEMKAEIGQIRREYLDRATFDHGLSPTAGMNVYNEVRKQGIPDTQKSTDLVMTAHSGLEVDVKAATDILGVLARTMGKDYTVDRGHSALNAIAVAAREDPSRTPDIMEGAKRAMGTLSFGKFRFEDVVGLVSGGDSVGIDPGKAGTTVTAMARSMAQGSMGNLLDKHRKKELTFAAREFGFGSARAMAQAIQVDGGAAIRKVMDKATTMTPQQRFKAFYALGQNQWGDEFNQFHGGWHGTKKTLGEINDPKNADFIDEVNEIKMQSWRKKVDQINNLITRTWDAIGLGFESIFDDVIGYFKDSGSKVDFGRVTTLVKEALGGFLQGLGIGDVRKMLADVFGGGGDVTRQVRAFATGLGSGLRSVFDAVKGMMGAFSGGSQDPETIGRITGKILGLSAALVVISPVVGVLGAVASAIGGIAGAARAVMAIDGLIAGVGAAGSAGATATAAAAGWPVVGSLIAAGFVKYLSGLGANAADQNLGIDGKNALSFSGLQRMLFKPFGAFGYAYDWMNGQDAVSTGPSVPRDTSPEGTQRVIDDSRRQIEELRQRIEPNTKALEGNTKALIEKRSAVDPGMIGGLRQNASLGSSDVQSMGARFQLAALTSTGALTTGTIRDQILGGSIPGGGGSGGGRGGSGGGYVPGGGGASLSGNTPGQSFSVPGVGSRYGVGPSFGAPGSNQGMPDPRSGAGVGPYKPILDHIAQSEGTARAPGGGYDTSLGYGKYLPGGQEQNLTGKSLDEILALGNSMRRQPGNPNSSALGRYQIVGSTLRNLMGKLGLSGNEKFDEAMQDRLGAELVRGRGSNARGLAQEWASLRGDKLARAVELAQGIPSGSPTTPGPRTASAGGGMGASGSVGERIADLRRSGAITGTECVDLVKGFTGTQGITTKQWGKGDNAQAGTLKAGDAVATYLDQNFNPSDRYAGGSGGQRGFHKDHAAIFDKYIKDEQGRNIGMHVYEQYAKTRGRQVEKDYFFGKGYGEGDGSNYHKVLGPDGKPLGGGASQITDGVTKSAREAAQAFSKPIEGLEKGVGDLGKGFTSSGWMKDEYGRTNGGPWINKRTGEEASPAKKEALNRKFDAFQERVRKFTGGSKDTTDWSVVHRADDFKSTGWKRADDAPSLTDKAKEALGGKPGTFTGKDEDKGFSSTGWKKAEAADLAAETPAQRLASQAPARFGGSGGAARSGPSTHAPITIINNGDAEHTANQVQRRIQDTQNYLNQGQSFESV